MKTLFLSLFFLVSQGAAEPSSSPKAVSGQTAGEEHTDKSRGLKPAESAEPSGPVTEKIQKIFEEFIEILEKKSIEPSEYSKAVRFLENSLYNEADFETLKLLADVYGQKGDLKNQINVLNILSVNHPDQPESFYLLGVFYKDSHFNRKKEQQEECKRQNFSCKGKKCKARYRACLVENKKMAIESFQKALKLDRRHIPSYESLMELFLTKDSKTGASVHTRESLSLSMDMLKNLKNRKYYIPLCKAYYDNKFLKQSQKACARSVQRNPRDPVSPLILALSYQEEAKTSQALLKVSKKFKSSFFVQYQTALYFMKKDVKTAVTHFTSAYALQPDHLQLNRMMSWFLFNNGEEKRAFEHFLKVCRLTQGGFLGDFRKARGLLRRKKMSDLVLKFQEGIEKCFLESRKRKQKK